MSDDNHAGTPEVTEPMARRVIAYWASVDADLGARVAAGLGSGDGSGAGGSNGASAEASELLAARANRA